MFSLARRILDLSDWSCSISDVSWTLGKRACMASALTCYTFLHDVMHQPVSFRRSETSLLEERGRRIYLRIVVVNMRNTHLDVVLIAYGSLLTAEVPYHSSAIFEHHTALVLCPLLSPSVCWSVLSGRLKTLPPTARLPFPPRIGMWSGSPVPQHRSILGAKCNSTQGSPIQIEVRFIKMAARVQSRIGRW